MNRWAIFRRPLPRTKGTLLLVQSRVSYTEETDLLVPGIHIELTRMSPELVAQSR